MKILYNYEQDAKLRAHVLQDHEFDDLDSAYSETDLVLEDAEMVMLPSRFFDMRIRQQSGQRGFMIEFRSRFHVECDRDMTSEAYWRFIPDESYTKQFIIENVSILIASDDCGI